jgi:hypothetical protein
LGEPASSTRAAAASPSRNHAAKEATPPPLADAAALLRTVANAAAGITELLDTLRDHDPAEGLQGPHPVSVALEQAAAAADDLCVSAHAAADTILAPPADPESVGYRPTSSYRPPPR